MGRMSAEEDYKGCWDNGADAAVVVLWEAMLTLGRRM